MWDAKISTVLAAGLLAIASPPSQADASMHDRNLIILGGDAQPVDISAAIAELQTISEANKGNGRIDPYAPFRVSIDEGTGRPTTVAGHFPTRARASRPAAVAEAFLTQHRALFGLDGDAVRLQVLNTQVDTLGMAHTRLAVVVQGLVIDNAEILVHSEGRMVRSVTAAPVVTRGLVLSRQVSPHDAIALAKDDLKGHLMTLDETDGAAEARYDTLSLNASPSLVWLDTRLFNGIPAAPAAAWKINIAGWQYYISAADGSVLLSWDNWQAALNRNTYNTFNSTSLPGSLVLSESTGDPAAETTDIDILDAHIFAEWAWDYYAGHHERDSWDGGGAQINCTVHYSTSMVNAFWNGQQLVFGDGDRMVQDDVMMHELTHGVIQESGGMVYMWQPGALNEAVADIFAFFATGDPLIGEGLEMGALRDISHPSDYGQPEDMDGFFYLPRFVDNGGVHIFSSIPAHAAYLMTVGGEKDGVSVAGQGADAIEKVWYRSLTTQLHAFSNFSHARISAEIACGELFTSGSEVCGAVSTAFVMQGIGY